MTQGEPYPNPHDQPGFAPPQYGPPAAPPRKPRKTLMFVLLGVGVLLLACCGGGTIIAMNAPDKTANEASESGPSATAAATSAAPGTAESSAAAPTSPPANTEANPKPAPAEATVGTPVRDGKFEFVVKKVECGKSKVGGEYLNTTAQGQFCLVTMSVKNIGDEPQMFSDSNQKAFSSTGAEFATDSTASLYANNDAQVWINNINPGNSITGIIVFDIPKDAKIARLQLHDSMFSGGVKVGVS